MKTEGRTSFARYATATVNGDYDVEADDDDDGIVATLSTPTAIRSDEIFVYKSQPIDWIIIRCSDIKLT